jgi:predicted hydrocarbon binding protein
MSNNFECEGQQSDKPNSQFIRGHIAGLFSNMLNEDLDCRETKCMALGDPYCEFVIARSQLGIG